jgi:hypothetical protein
MPGPSRRHRLMISVVENDHEAPHSRPRLRDAAESRTEATRLEQFRITR